MNWKTTWILVGSAAALFACIVVFERRGPDPRLAQVRLFSFRAAEVTNIQLRLTNQLLLRVERAKEGAPWNLSVPLTYPAKAPAIEWLLQSLENTVPQTEVTAQELKASKRTIAEFGLDIPQATLTLHHGGQRTEILFGARTPVGDGVYAEVLNQPGIFILNGELSARLPRSHNDWRDPSLFGNSPAFSRIDVRAGGRGFAFDLDATNRAFVLTRPTVARADPGKVDALLRRIFVTQIAQFVTDNPRVELDGFGLQPPELELVLMQGTNDLFVVQFGRSPTNDPGLVYARRLSHTNIVVVPRPALEALQISHADLRDLHLVSWSTNTVDAIEVIGGENFVARRQTNGTWLVGEAQPVLADTNAVRDWLDVLSRLEGAVEKDVVTDFANPYGLAPPARQYVLRTTVPNAGGVLSNRVVAELYLGKRQDDRIFARRPDEATVYSLAPKDVFKLPYAAWQVRDRAVWNFTTGQVQRISVRFEGRSYTLQRHPSASWTVAEGSAVSGNWPQLEETLRRLGELRAGVWVARGEEARPLYGFRDDNDRITIELRNGDKLQVHVLEFGGPSPTQLPYALTTVDGETRIFEFPPTLRFELIRDLFSPLFRSK